MTSKAVWMADRSILELKTSTLDAFAAISTHRIVELVIMSFTIWPILEDIKTRGFERFLTSGATKTTFMISPRELPVL